MQPGELIVIQGTVQGVGFRPTVARLAREHGFSGWIRNTPRGVELALAADQERCTEFLTRLKEALPPLAQVAKIERQLASLDVEEGFAIHPSSQGPSQTSILSDVAICRECLEEIGDPSERRFRYPFANCTCCGPRFSIIQAIPYDRGQTTMASFAMCEVCRAEYEDDGDRRFHAQPIACHACGPRAWLERADGQAFDDDGFSALDAIDAAASLLRQGEIVAIKGLGGFQLCCDATQEDVVARLRQRKRRLHKPFAMMVRDLEVLATYAAPTAVERAAVSHHSGPIVLMDRSSTHQVAASVAPGQSQIGVMLPTTPLHALLLAQMEHPIICTSGNLTSTPQCIDNDEAKETLSTVADWFLLHDREIAQRVDDSVLRVIGGEPRVLRYARGFAPLPVALPPGFAEVERPPLLAMGGQQKAAFCLLMDEYAVLSPYMGDLDNLETLLAWQQMIDAMMKLHQCVPGHIAVDLHPGYEATKMGQGMARSRNVPLTEIQHHHAHIASCLAEHQRPLDAPPVLGIALDGLGAGPDGQLWGGEFLIADYASYTRVGTMKPVAMIGGDRASREPWRNLYAHLMAALGWAEMSMHFSDLELYDDLKARPRAILDPMLESGQRAPLASSCGRLFDAVAAALGLFRDAIEYEGQAAMALEALVTPLALEEALSGELYPIAIPLLYGKGLHYIEPEGIWRGILGDLGEGCDHSLIAARFHVTLAQAIGQMAARIQRQRHGLDTVALSGGVWQNRVLFELVSNDLEERGFYVLSHKIIPANDGGLALGQALVAAARLQREGAP